MALAKPSFSSEEEQALIDVIRSGWVTQGPKVAAFEERFAHTVGVDNAVAVTSATTALFLSLHALGIGAGDEVVVPSLTFIASVNPIVQVGATLGSTVGQMLRLSPARIKNLVACGAAAGVAATFNAIAPFGARSTS